MRRRLINIGVALSVVLCVAVCALWFVTQFDNLAWTVGRDVSLVPPATEVEVKRLYSLGGGRFGLFQRTLTSGPSGFGGATKEVWSIPVLPLAVLLGLPFAIRVAKRLARRIQRWRSARWRVIGCCPACGYDLRASAGRCPECGGATEGQ